MTGCSLANFHGIAAQMVRDMLGDDCDIAIAEGGKAVFAVAKLKLARDLSQIKNFAATQNSGKGQKYNIVRL